MRIEGTTNKTKRHILENDIFSSHSATKYIDDVIYLIKETMSSPTCALFLNDLYDNTYNIKYDKDIENVFGATLYRDTEDFQPFTGIDRVYNDYIVYDIKEKFGLSIDEYLAKNIYEKEILDNIAIEQIKAMSEEMENLKNDINRGEKEYE